MNYVSIHNRLSLEEISLFSDKASPSIAYVHRKPLVLPTNVIQIKHFPDLTNGDECALFVGLMLNFQQFDILVIDPVSATIDLFNFERICKTLHCYGIGLLE